MLKSSTDGLPEMSRQVPYGSFEDGLILQILNKIPDIFDDFVLELVRYNTLAEERPDFGSMRLPWIFYDQPLIEVYWSCLCRMYGQVYLRHWPRDYVYDYIPYENISLAVQHVTRHVRQIFPSTWDYSDSPVLHLKNIAFD